MKDRSMIFGFSPFEAMSIAGTFIGFIWWLAAIYWQLKQAVKTLEKIEVDLSNGRQKMDEHDKRITSLEYWRDNIWPGHEVGQV